MRRVFVLRLFVDSPVDSVPDASVLEHRMSEIGVGEALIEFDLDVVASSGEWEATS